MGNAAAPPEPLSILKSPSVSAPVHIPKSSFTLNTSYLHFFCYAKSTANIIIRFFVFDHGLKFIQDSTNPLPIQEFSIPAATETALIARLNRAYIDEYIFDNYLPLPIVIEALTDDYSEITIVEILNNEPRVVQQRVIWNQMLFELKNVQNIPNFQSEENEKLCMICYYNLRDTICEPCCHLVLCLVCAEFLRRQSVPKCPSCRNRKRYTEIEAFIRLKAEKVGLEGINN